MHMCCAIASHEILIIHTITIKINAYLFWEWIIAVNGVALKCFSMPFKRQWCEKSRLIYWKILKADTQNAVLNEQNEMKRNERQTKKNANDM